MWVPKDNLIDWWGHLVFSLVYDPGQKVLGNFGVHDFFLNRHCPLNSFQYELWEVGNTPKEYLVYCWGHMVTSIVCDPEKKYPVTLAVLTFHLAQQYQFSSSLCRLWGGVWIPKKHLNIHSDLSSHSLTYYPGKIPISPHLTPSIFCDHGNKTLNCDPSPRFTYDPWGLHLRIDLDGILDLHLSQ